MKNKMKPAINNAKDQDGQFIPVSETFFTQNLPVMNDLANLKLLLSIFRILERSKDKTGYLPEEAILSDPLVTLLFDDEEQIKSALKDLIAEKALLTTGTQETGTIYYLPDYAQSTKTNNQEKDRQRDISDLTDQQIEEVKPNIFKLYEENIGAITPMMAEILKEDEKTYPETWIEDAIRIAVTRNARNWKYVQAILDRWQKEGRENDKNRRDDSQDPERYRRSWLRDK